LLYLYAVNEQEETFLKISREQKRQWQKRYYSTLKTQVALPSETLTTLHQSKCHHIPEQNNVQIIQAYFKCSTRCYNPG